MHITLEVAHRPLWPREGVEYTNVYMGSAFRVSKRREVGQERGGMGEGRWLPVSRTPPWL